MKFFLRLFFVLMPFSFLAADGFASCGAACCPMDSRAHQKQKPGVLHLDYLYEYADQSKARIGADPASVGEIRGHHDEIFTQSKIQTLRIGAALSSRLFVDLSVPFVHREHQHIHHHRGKNLLESWNMDGIGDLAVQVRLALLQPSREELPAVSLILGGKFPTGKNDARGISQDENNQLNSEIAEAGIQPGSGAYDLIVGASSLQFLSVPMIRDGHGQMPLFAEVLGRFTGKGRDDYRLGNSLTAIAGAVYPLFRKLAVSGQVNARYSRKDEKGTTSEEIDKTGGVWVYAVPGVQLNLTDDVMATVNVPIPVYQNVNSIQLVSTYSLMLGLSYKFNLR